MSIKADTVVYISGPITCTNYDRTLAFYNAFMVDRELRFRRLGVINPILTAYLPFAFDGTFTHADWLHGDFALVERCDAVYRLPGPSTGADMEVDFARERDIPVFDNLADLDSWLEVRETAKLAQAC